MDFNSKKWWKEKIFYKTKAKMSFILKSRMSLWWLIMKKKRVYCMKSVFILIDKQTLILESGGEKSFLNETQSINIIYPNMENRLMVLNHEKKKDYYVNPCLSQFTNEI